MSETRVPDPTLMARLQLSVKGVDWAASLVAAHQFDTPDDGWTPHQHLFHLVSAETEVYQPRIQALLERSDPEFQAWDPDENMRTGYGRSDDIAALADRFMAERECTVGMLKAVERDAWRRTARWPDGRIVDVAWVAERVLEHALDHFVSLLELHGQFTPRQSAAWFGGATSV